MFYNFSGGSGGASGGGVTLLQWALDHGMVNFANVVIKYGARKPPKWTADESVNDCCVCKREFSLFRCARFFNLCFRLCA